MNYIMKDPTLSISKYVSDFLSIVEPGHFAQRQKEANKKPTPVKIQDFIS